MLPPILAIGCLFVVLVPIELERGLIGRYIVPWQFGLLIGQTSVAAAWAVFGPGRWKTRVLLSLAWICLLATMLFLSHCVLYRRIHIYVALLPLFGLLSQWLLVQAVLWIPARIYGLRMVHESDHLRSISPDKGIPETPRRPQFGTRHLMLLIAMVAIALGLLRSMATINIIPRRELLVLSTLVAAAVLTTLPLLLSALPGYGRTVTGIVVFSLLAAILGSEFGLSQAIGLRNRLPNDWHCVWLYAHTAFWVLFPVCAARLSGYVLATQPAAESLTNRTASRINLDPPPVSASPPRLPASAPPSPSATGD